ncbi:MAG: pyrroline-5-carboxylate reductase [Candidatus Caldatribacterium sp.]|uniref:pyrroline-5-carboxylate reductase n=1 Tax=Candidatus Caldatribacterium sp. TaxID=2282143 RepID=UPI0029980BF4|nr:pyrroline-5-carboxylate reductase [Candidatus Caldatribacterium sp.]MCX7729824.1 pyrroline-5-carboxylate reductase [Candidatus Caldatribacterium sp.]MDW8080459.1 pyrroline-5-carboxylate reductase [Candidatus Calescibacterium sp.]
MKGDILFFGCGNMGSALVRGLVRDGWHKKYRFLLFDKVSERAQSLAASCGVTWVENPLLYPPRFVFFAVKPKDVPEAAASLVSWKEGVLVSVVAGVSVGELRRYFSAPIVRIMPNLCVEVGEGVVPAYFSQEVPGEDREELLFLFASLGWVFEASEEELDPLTALSGGGPGVVARFIEGLMDGGVKIGLPWEKSLRLAVQTVLGTALLLKERGMHPGVLKNLVASPGGTTIAGLHVLEKMGFTGILMESVEAAYRRVQEFSGKAR